MISETMSRALSNRIWHVLRGPFVQGQFDPRHNRDKRHCRMIRTADQDNSLQNMRRGPQERVVRRGLKDEALDEERFPQPSTQKDADPCVRRFYAKQQAPI